MADPDLSPFDDGDELWGAPFRAMILDISRRADGQSPQSSVAGSTTTLIASQAGAMLEMTSSSPNTVNVPPNVFTAGQVVEVCQAGTGATSIAQATGMTLRCRGETAPFVLAGQWSEVRIRFRSGTEAVVSGDVT